MAVKYLKYKGFSIDAYDASKGKIVYIKANLYKKNIIPSIYATYYKTLSSVEAAKRTIDRYKSGNIKIKSWKQKKEPKGTTFEIVTGLKTGFSVKK